MAVQDHALRPGRSRTVSNPGHLVRRQLLVLTCSPSNDYSCFSSPGAHLDQDQFNWLATVLYITVMVFEVRPIVLLKTTPRQIAISSTHRISPYRGFPLANGSGPFSTVEG